MSMDQFINEYFAGQQVSTESFEKEAQVELFAKLAASNGIDLEQLSEGQIEHLWNETFKTASEDEGDEEKVEKAKEEHEKKKESAAKIAEADFLGRQMAISMVDELQKQAADGEKGEPGFLKKKYEAAKEHAGKAGKYLAGGFKGEGLGDAKKSIQTAFGKMQSHEKRMPHLKHHLGEAAKKIAPTAVAYGGSAAALGGLAYGAKKLHDKHKEKSSSAIDQLAAEEALNKAASAGWNAEEAASRLDAVLTLGVDESEKIAFVQDLASAVEVRSLELLEAAGYPVTWQQ